VSYGELIREQAPTNPLAQKVLSCWILLHHSGPLDRGKREHLVDIFIDAYWLWWHEQEKLEMAGWLEKLYADS
jgi:hypothetical protein